MSTLRGRRKSKKEDRVMRIEEKREMADVLKLNSNSLDTLNSAICPSLFEEGNLNFLKTKILEKFRT